MATRTSLLMQVSAPIVVELLRNGRYENCVMKPGAFCIAPVGPAPAARWRGQRSILVLELSPWLLNSVAEANEVLRIELQAGSAVDDPQIAYLLLALRADLANSSPSGRAYVDAISRAVAYRLLMAHGVSPSLRPSHGGLSQRSLRRVLEFIDAHLDRDLPLKSMADISGLSVDHFARAFRESTGEPPHTTTSRQAPARAL